MISKKTILYSAAGACGVLLFGLGFLTAKLVQRPPEEPPVVEPLFTEELARQGAEYLTDLCAQKVQTQYDLNHCAATAAVLKQAELFAVFNSYASSLPEPERRAALQEQIEWQTRYLEEMSKSSSYDGGALAVAERGFRSYDKVSDRIIWLTGTPEMRAAYLKMKNLSFTGPDRMVRTLSDGEFTGGDGSEGTFKLLPEFCIEEGEWLAGVILCRFPGLEMQRMIGVWKNGTMKLRLFAAKTNRVDTLRFRDGKLLITSTTPDGKKRAMNVKLD